MQTSKIKKKTIPLYMILMLVLVCVTAGCGGKQADPASVTTGDSSQTLVIGAYSVAKDAVGELRRGSRRSGRQRRGRRLTSKSLMRLQEHRPERLLAGLKRM